MNKSSVRYKNTGKIVIVNQAVNYLTIGICNAFQSRFEDVQLITGSIHVQGEELHPEVKVRKIKRFAERPPTLKLYTYLIATVQIYWLLTVRYRKHEVLFLTNPPMAYLLSGILMNRCSFLIWDVYPDLFKITGMEEDHILYRIWAKLNRIAFKKSYRIFTIGEKMATLLSEYIDRDKIMVTPIWSIFQENCKVCKNENPFIIDNGISDKFIVQYSGNIGLTHRVETMVELAERMNGNSNVLFQIIGRGPRMEHLRKLVMEKKLDNCMFLPFQTDEMFPYSLSAADLGVVILDEMTSKGSVPSKSYNLMSYGIPSLYIASYDSELNDYSKKYKHARCFEEKDLDLAVDFIKELSGNKDLHSMLSENSEKAANNFRRSNADRIVSLYVSGGDE